MKGEVFIIRHKMMYFTGTSPVMVSVKRDTTATVVVNPKGKPAPQYMNKKANNGYYHDRRLKKMKWEWSYKTTEEVDVPNGKFASDWSEDSTKAKEFRRLSQAEKTCDKIKQELKVDIDLIIDTRTKT